MAFASGVLYVATDNEEFTFAAPPDRIAKIETNGPNVVSSTILVTDYPVNGLADGGGFMFAGDPLSNTLRTIDFDGNLLTSVSAGFPAFCCNEDMAFDPVPQVGRPDGTLYHPHWSDNIQAIDPFTGVVFQTFAIDQVVGMAHVGGDIWITKWSPRQVGPWDPTTNTFTPIFNTPSNAGMLAYDPLDGILWVGLLGGTIRPYDLAGNILGPDFLPFGNNPNTIDGGVFQGESGSGLGVEIDIKPGSDPSSVSCKNTNDNVPVAVFGSENFDVTTIDLATLELNGVPVTEVHGTIHVEDKNGDEFPDAVLHLDKAGVCDATSDESEYPLKKSADATLTGSTTDGIGFSGTGDIRIVNR